MNPRMNAIIMRKGCKSNLSFNFKELKNHAASVKHTIYFMKSSSFCKVWYNFYAAGISIKEWFRLRFLEERSKYINITCVRPSKQVGRGKPGFDSNCPEISDCQKWPPLRCDHIERLRKIAKSGTQVSRSRTQHHVHNNVHYAALRHKYGLFRC